MGCAPAHYSGAVDHRIGGPQQAEASVSGKNDFVLLVATHPAALDHQPGAWHPERPERLHAVLDALRAPEIAKHTAEVEPREAASSELAAVHDAELIELFAKLDAAGGGAIDADTTMSKHSLRASRLAAGAGLACVDALRAGEGDAAFVAMRPPGHHTSPSRAMGFCLLNNVAVTARALADAGERVLILDWDVHHGNGTQEAFWDDPRVLFVSLHQYGIYPGTGAADEVGESGNVINVPLPAGTTGDAYQLAIDEIVEPSVAAFEPSWVLVSAGFDAHLADPLAGLSLSSGDFAELAGWAHQLAPARTILFLEGGYDLDALRSSVGAVAGRLVGTPGSSTAPTRDGAGIDAVRSVATWRSEAGLI